MKPLVLLVVHRMSSSAAAGAVAPGSQRDPSVFAEGLVVGGILAAIGALAFSGVWRGWANGRMFRVYRVWPLAVGWAGVGFLVSDLGDFLPQPVSDLVVYGGLAFAGLCLPGMVWLPRPFLPRWYKVQMGLDRDTWRKRVVASVAGKGGLPLSGSLGEAPGGGEEKVFGAASQLGGVVGGVAADAPHGLGLADVMRTASSGSAPRAEGAPESSERERDA